MNIHQNPVDTRRRFNVYTTCIRRQRQKNEQSPDIITEIFNLIEKSCNLGNLTQTQKRANHTYYGTETLPSLAPKNWDVIPPVGAEEAESLNL